MKIAVACDHGGLDLKNKIVEYLKSEGHEVIDEGTYTKDSVIILFMLEKLQRM